MQSVEMHSLNRKISEPIASRYEANSHFLHCVLQELRRPKEAHVEHITKDHFLDSLSNENVRCVCSCI